MAHSLAEGPRSIIKFITLRIFFLTGQKTSLPVQNNFFDDSAEHNWQLLIVFASFDYGIINGFTKKTNAKSVLPAAELI